MNKRLKKKRKLETAIVMLIAELRSIIQQNAQAINREFEAVKSATLDNQAAIKSIGDEVAVIKNKKWWFKKRS